MLAIPRSGATIDSRTDGWCEGMIGTNAVRHPLRIWLATILRGVDTTAVFRVRRRGLGAKVLHGW